MAVVFCAGPVTTEVAACYAVAALLPCLKCLGVSYTGKYQGEISERSLGETFQEKFPNSTSYIHNYLL